jgi:hypothetical protein
MMLLLCVALALMCLGLFGMLVAVSRAFCDMQARAEAAEAMVNSLAKRTPAWIDMGYPAGWFGFHES